ncbi:MarR family winged helix-turn-helix transcriptional regulator [Qipengyuania nanhaisediminis]|uniref:MarR family winged helix-turn-helix transcriptional regulator n=1 Tax=Qipengyuania nanhaisediminis TaxID=604088 RepID=UPI0038B2B0C9
MNAAADPRVTSDGRERLRLWLRLLSLSRRIESKLRERLRTRFGSTLPRFDVMAALARSPEGLTMGGLSQMLLVSNGNVTGIVERLAEDGLVTRNTHEGDRRASVVRLTRPGQAAFSEMAEAHAVWIDELLGGFAPEEARELAAMLARGHVKLGERT